MDNKTRKNKQQQNSGLSKVQDIQPLTSNQKLFFQNYKNYTALMLAGCAGTGKSMISIFQALKSVERGEYKEIIILRSAVSSRDIGFVPGTKKEKMEVYEGPYFSIFNKLYGRGDAYQILKQKSIVRFESTSFLRGETFEDCIVIFDECQNASYQELYTILTRVGDNCKLILCGDSAQDDLTSKRYNETSGFDKIKKLLSIVQDCRIIDFTTDDIVRSGFVKQIILASQQFG